MAAFDANAIAAMYQENIERLIKPDLDGCRSMWDCGVKTAKAQPRMKNVLFTRAPDMYDKSQIACPLLWPGLLQEFGSNAMPAIHNFLHSKWRPDGADQFPVPPHVISDVESLLQFLVSTVKNYKKSYKIARDGIDNCRVSLRAVRDAVNNPRVPPAERGHVDNASFDALDAAEKIYKEAIPYDADVFESLIAVIQMIENKMRYGLAKKHNVVREVRQHTETADPFDQVVQRAKVQHEKSSGGKKNPHRNNAKRDVQVMCQRCDKLFWPSQKNQHGEGKCKK